MTMSDDRRERRIGDKDPSEIEAEIAQTREEISERLNAIGEKLSPEQIKQEARQALGEAKEAVVERLRDAKDSALHSMNETLQDVGERARRAGEVSYGFARENAIPLGLIGLGIGWLVMSGRRRKNARDYRWRIEEREAYGSYGPEPGGVEYGGIEQQAEGARERMMQGAGRARDRMMQGAERARERARERAHELGERANELGRRARDRAIHAEHEALDFARENPLAIGAAAMAVGVGVGLLLPPTRREDEFLGERRDRLVGDIRSSVEGVGRAAKDTAREVQGALREAPRS
jgi:ElaB/YqjD/DUF883 family membrane-anchored ribosome-binding protein